MKAVIELDVPEWQIGQDVSVYFPDTMLKHGKCELLKEQNEPKQIIRKQCKKEHEDGSVDYFAEWYCPHCNSLILRGFDNPSIKFCYKCGKPILGESM